MSEAKRIVLLGATGSIGESTLKVIREYKERFEVVGIAANNNIEKLAAISKEFNVPNVGIFDEASYKKALSSGQFNNSTKFVCGEDGLSELASLPEADIIVMAIVGTAGLHPTLAAIKKSKTIALASKEILVMAGSVVMEAARQNNAQLLPLDSEHSAIFQCLNGEAFNSIEKIILTASGGPFRNYTLSQMQNITVEDALKHPNWEMGNKITIDCATMANKGLELIEAKWLFDVPAEKLEVLVHPQSIIHSLVQFVDGSVTSQLAPPDMTFPIQYALHYPKRTYWPHPSLDFSQKLNLELYPPNLEQFPALALAIEAMKEGGIAPAIFNAANEIAVENFIAKKIPFLKIPQIIDSTLEKLSNDGSLDLDKILEIDKQAKAVAQELIG